MKICQQSIVGMLTWSALLAMWSPSSSYFCRAQENDECAEALDITLPFVGTSLTSTGAVPAPTFASPACDVDAGVPGVWYRFTTPTTGAGLLRATVTNQGFTARVSAYAGAECDTCIGNTQAFGFTTLVLEWLAEADTTYAVLVSGSGATESGTFDLTVELAEPTPAHTACEGAVSITTTPFVVMDTTVAARSGVFADASCDVDAEDRALWYQLTVSEDVIVEAVVDEKTFGARLSLYRGSDCGALECLANTNAFTFSDSTLEFAALVGQTYHLLVSGGDANDAGTFRLSVTGLPEPPNQECAGATDITQLPFEVFESNRPAVNGFSNLACNVDESSRGMWYQLTLDDDTVVVATVSDQEFNAALSVYGGDGCETLECLFGQDSYFQYLDRGLVTAASAGTTYYYRVSGQDFQETGNFRFGIQGLDEPAHEVCNGAQVVSSFPFSITESTAGAFPYFSSLECGVAETTRGLWYAVSVTDEDRVLRATLSGQEFDVSLSLFVGTCDDLSCSVGTDPFQFLDRVVTWAARVGQTYYLHVNGEEFIDAGTFTLDVVALERPVHDVCAEASDLGTSPASVFETNDGAVPVLGFADLECNLPSGTRGLWYQYTPVESAVHVARIEDQTFNTRLSLFLGSCDSLNCRRASGPYQYVTVGLVLAAYTGRTEYLHVSGEDFEEAGNFRLNLEALPRPPNDTCEGAIEISETTGAFTTTNEAALPQFESVACDVNRNSRVLWYSFTPTETAVYRVAISDYEWEAVVSVFDGQCGDPVCRATDDYCATIIVVFPYILYCDFDVTFTGIAGTTYHIAVSGNDGFEPAGLFRMNLLRTNLPVPNNPAPSPPSPVQPNSPTSPSPTTQPNTAPSSPNESASNNRDISQSSRALDVLSGFVLVAAVATQLLVFLGG